MKVTELDLRRQRLHQKNLQLPQRRREKKSREEFGYF
jgi:hypothetical protein